MFSFFDPDALCPHCLKKLTRNDIKVTCKDCADQKTNQGTGENGNQSNGELVFSLLDYWRYRAPRCQVPGHHTSPQEWKCGHCGQELPPQILGYEGYLRFSVIGVQKSGKTSFLVTMLREFQNHKYDGIHPWVLRNMTNNDGTLQWYNDNYNRMYLQHTPLDATPKDMPSTLLWTLGNRLKKTASYTPTYSLTIFDGAGEDYEKVNENVSRCIAGSKTLVVLIDPVALPGIRKDGRIPEETIRNSGQTDLKDSASVDMVNGLADYIRMSCGLRPGMMIDRDVAVVFTKMDAVESTFSEGATVRKESPHMDKKGFDVGDADNVNDEIKAWLIGHGENVFLDTLWSNFKNDRIRFFGVSSYGHVPGDATHLKKIIPHRVVDPFVWMLAKEGIVPEIRENRGAD